MPKPPRSALVLSRLPLAGCVAFVFALVNVIAPFGSSAQTAVGANPAPQPAINTPEPAFKNWTTRESTTAPPPRDMTDREKALVERATERQQLLAKGEYKAAYEFLSPSSKAFKSFSAFEAEARGSSLRETKATRAECDKDGRCSVTLVAKAGLQQPKIGTLSVPVMTQEVWLIQSSGEALLILR